MRIIGYARVSSREQSENSHALEQQIARLNAAGATEIYFDVQSRSRDDREGLNKVLDLIRTRQCDEAIFVRIDRMTDSATVLEGAIEICLASEIRIRGLDDAIDLHTVGGRMHARLLVTIARGEVERLAERVRHGWAYLRERKVAMHPPFGYTKVDDKHELDHEPFLCLLACPVEPLMDRRTRNATDLPVQWSEAMIADALISSFFQYRTLRRSLRWMNETYGIQTFAHNQGKQRKGGRMAQQVFRFSPYGLRNWLTNPVLQGHVAYLRKSKRRQVIHYDTHPEHRLLSTEEATEIEQILTQNRQIRGFGTTAQRYPCSGLVFCAECRSTCYSVSGRKNYKHPERGYNYYFQCKNWRLRACTQKHTIRMEQVEQAVIDALLDRAKAVSTIAHRPAVNEDPPALQELRTQLTQLESIPGDNPAIRTARDDIRNQIQLLQQSLTIEDTSRVENQDLLLQVFGDRSYWKTLMDEEKREIYRTLVGQVMVRDGQVERIELQV